MADLKRWTLGFLKGTPHLFDRRLLGMACCRQQCSALWIATAVTPRRLRTAIALQDRRSQVVGSGLGRVARQGMRQVFVQPSMRTAGVCLPPAVPHGSPELGGRENACHDLC